jgi:hypothetical protein
VDHHQAFVRYQAEATTELRNDEEGKLHEDNMQPGHQQLALVQLIDHPLELEPNSIRNNLREEMCFISTINKDIMPAIITHDPAAHDHRYRSQQYNCHEAAKARVFFLTRPWLCQHKSVLNEAPMSYGKQRKCERALSL